LYGTITGFGVAWMLVTMLAGVFDPPPESITVPVGYASAVLVGTVAVAAAVVAAFERAHRLTDPSALKPE
jgi:putative ABC transport system permease protein